MATLTLTTLGSLSLRGPDGEELSALLAQPKRLALMVYLALAPPRGFQRRDTLLGVFWPESDTRKARGALSQSLHFLRHHLPPGCISTRGLEEIGLAPGFVRTDLSAFEGALAEERWADALKLYRGDFLNGFHLSGAPGFEEWADHERARLGQAVASAAWCSATVALERGALDPAERTALRAVDLAWTDETHVRAFVERLALSGDRAGALKLFERFCDRLRERWELDPSDRSLALMEAIRSGDMASGGPPAREVVEPEPAPPRAPPETAAPPSTAATPATGAPPQPAPSKSRWRPSLVAVAVMTVLTAAAVTEMAVRGGRHTGGPPATPPGQVTAVLADVGGTADRLERDAVTFLLRTGLDVDVAMRTVPESQVSRTLVLMGKEDLDELDPVTARAAGVRLGVPAVLVSRLDRLGSLYTLTLRVEDAESGHLYVGATGHAHEQEELVGVVDSLVVQLLRGLGAARESLAQRRPLPDVLTPSLEALMKYQEARRDVSAGRFRQAATLLREAVTLDTAFAMAWSHLASTYGNYLGMPDSAAEAALQVRRHPDRLTRARRDDQDLHRRMREDVALWDRALHEAEASVTRDPSYVNNYAVYVGTEGGRPDSAFAIRMAMERRYADAAQQFGQDTPYDPTCHINTTFFAVAAGRVDEWLAFLRSVGVDERSACFSEATFLDAVAAERWSSVDSLLHAGRAPRRWDHMIPAFMAQLDVVEGRIGRVASLPDPTWCCLRDGWGETARLLTEVGFGPQGHPTRTEMELEGRGRGPVVRYILHGVREALVGDTVESRRVERRMTLLRDSATSRTFERAFASWFALMRAGPAVRRGDWTTVIEVLEPVAEDLRAGGGGYIGGDTFLVPWTLAQAYEACGEPELAAARLEDLLRRPTFRTYDWTLHGFIAPAAIFKVAGLYARMGETTAARDRYRLFLDTFTDPDPEVGWMRDQAAAALASLGG